MRRLGQRTTSPPPTKLLYSLLGSWTAVIRDVGNCSIVQRVRSWPCAPRAIRASAGIVEAAIGAHGTVRRAGLRIELHACVSKIELCLIVVDEHRVCLELAALHAIGSEQRAHAKSDLLRGVDGSRRTDWRLLVLLARDGAGDAADRDDEQSDAPNAHDRAHPTRARMRSCKCTTPTNSA